MKRLAHQGSSCAVHIEAEFAHARYIVVPGLIWAAAILVAIFGTLAPHDGEAQRAAATPPAEAATVAHGA
jgi:hypothetical protein